MIELGQEVFNETHKPFDRGDFTDADLTARLLSVVAEAQHRGMNLPDLIGPFIAATEETEEIAQERQEQLDEIKAKLAEKFTGSDKLLGSGDFSIVRVGAKDGVATDYVALTTATGLFKGSFRSIMSDSESNTAAYTVEINGQPIDTRTAMTRRLHRALAVQALASFSASQAGGPGTFTRQIRFGTWYTGDRSTPDMANFGYDSEPFPERRSRKQSAVFNSIRFRPAVLVPEL